MKSINRAEAVSRFLAGETVYCGAAASWELVDGLQYGCCSTISRRKAAKLLRRFCSCGCPRHEKVKYWCRE